MKIVTASSGKKTIKMSKSEWQQIGKTAGWLDSVKGKLAGWAEKLVGPGPKAQAIEAKLQQALKDNQQISDITNKAKEQLKLSEQQANELKSSLEQTKKELESTNTNLQQTKKREQSLSKELDSRKSVPSADKSVQEQQKVISRAEAEIERCTYGLQEMIKRNYQASYQNFQGVVSEFEQAIKQPHNSYLLQGLALVHGLSYDQVIDQYIKPVINKLQQYTQYSDDEKNAKLIANTVLKFVTDKISTPTQNKKKEMAAQVEQEASQM